MLAFRSAWTLLAAGAFLVSDAVRAEEKPLAIRGMVTDEHGAPARGVDVSTTRREEGLASAVTGVDGTFTLDVPRAAARGRLIRATADGGQLQAFAQLPWEEPEDGFEPVALKLEPAEQYAVVVRDTKGQPVAGATVGLLANFDLVETIASDANGRAVLLVPRDLNERFVFAIHKELGVDYRAYVLPRGQRGDRKAILPRPPEGLIELALDGGSRVQVHVIESDGKPIAGMPIYPWVLRKPGELEGLNFSYMTDLVQSPTDDRGWVEFAWLPKWHQEKMLFWADSDKHAEDYGEYDPESVDSTVTMVLQPLVPLRGRVTLPDGAPAGGIEVTASGAGYDVDGFRGTAKTDANGQYELLAAPNQAYLLTARGDVWAADPRTGFAVLPGPAVENLDFQLRLATRLFGRVTAGDDKRPVVGQQIQVSQYGQDANGIEGALANPENSPQQVQPTTVFSTATDEQGNFEVLIGSGKFDVRGPESAAIRKIDVTNQAELEFNFHTDRPERILLRGLVVADDATAIAGSKIVGVYRHGLAGRDLEAMTDDGGKFEVERLNHPVVLHAKSADGRQAGVVEIGADEMVAVIPLRPLATAVGRLLDAAGAPLAGVEIQYGVDVKMNDENAIRSCFGGRTQSDKDGRFTLKGLVLEQSYQMTVVVEDEGMSFSRNLGRAKVTEGGTLELGDFPFDATE